MVAAVRTHIQAGDLLCFDIRMRGKKTESAAGDLMIIDHMELFCRKIRELQHLILHPPEEHTVEAVTDWMMKIEGNSRSCSALRERINTPLPGELRPCITKINFAVESLLYHLNSTLPVPEEEGIPHHISALALHQIWHFDDTFPKFFELLSEDCSHRFYSAAVSDHECTIKLPLLGESGSLLQEEAKLLSQLPEHPGIIKTGLLRAQFQGTMTLHLEPLRGNCRHLFPSTHREVISRYRSFFQQTGRALLFLAEQGIVYNDFKPEKVFITADNRYVLADMTHATQHGAPFLKEATPYSPKDIFLYDESDSSMDVYSFGAVVLEACSGKTLPSGTPAQKLEYIRDLTEEKLSLEFASLTPPREAAEFIASFQEEEYVDFIDVYRAHTSLFDELDAILPSDSETSRNAIELIFLTIMAEGIGRNTYIDRDTAMKILQRMPKSDSKLLCNRILTQFTLFHIPLPFSYLQYLTLPREQFGLCIARIKETPPETLSTSRVRAAKIDPDGIMRHLARYAMRIKREDRPSMEKILAHPYFVPDTSIEEWQRELPLLPAQDEEEKSGEE